MQIKNLINNFTILLKNIKYKHNNKMISKYSE